MWRSAEWPIAPAASSDIIFADMYHAYEMDALQQQLLFLEQCKQILREDGWLVINFTILMPLQDPLILQMCALYPVVYLCGTTSGNWVVFCGKKEMEMELSSLWPEVVGFSQTTCEEIWTSFKRLIRIGR